MPVSLALRRGGQKDPEFKDPLGYITSSTPDWDICDLSQERVEIKTLAGRM